jgi:transposase
MIFSGSQAAKREREKIMARITRVVEHLPLEEVKERMRKDPHPLYRERWSIIYTAGAHPREAREIARDLGVTVSKVHTLIPQYNKLGVAAVETGGKGGRHREYMTFEEEEQLLATLFDRAARGEIVTAKQIKQQYEDKVGHEVNKTTIYRLIERHLWRKLSPRPQHPEVDKQQQEEFVKNFPHLVEEAISTRDQHDQRPLLIMAQDEGCFGRVSVPKQAWAPMPIRPQVGRQIVREYVYAYVAVAPKEGEMTCFILPYANTEMMNLFLKQVSADFAKYFIVMQVDQASWHDSKDLLVPENMRLIPQPAYSPELNPVEHIWDEIREKHFSNVCYSSLDSVIQTLSDALLEISSHPSYLRSMTYFPHLRIAV